MATKYVVYRKVVKRVPITIPIDYKKALSILNERKKKGHKNYYVGSSTYNYNRTQNVW